MFFICLEWYSFAYGMYQGNNFGAQIRSLSPYGIEDHGTSVIGHSAHVRLRDHNHVSGKGAGGNPAEQS
jgi:hypothetical protein